MIYLCVSRGHGGPCIDVAEVPVPWPLQDTGDHISPVVLPPSHPSTKTSIKVKSIYEGQTWLVHGLQAYHSIYLTPRRQVYHSIYLTPRRQVYHSIYFTPRRQVYHSIYLTPRRQVYHSIYFTPRRQWCQAWDKGAWTGIPFAGCPSQGYPSKGYPSQGYPSQGYPTQGYPSQGYPSPGVTENHKTRVFSEGLNPCSLMHFSDILLSIGSELLAWTYHKALGYEHWNLEMLVPKCVCPIHGGPQVAYSQLPMKQTYLWGILQKISIT